MNPPVKQATELSAADFKQIEKDLPAGDPPLIPSDVPSKHGSPGIIPVADLTLGEQEQANVLSCLSKGWISSAGSFIHQFEEAFANKMGCSQGVACSSGTTALHLAIVASGIGPGCEVILPTFTMIATINAVAYTGATPVLVDCVEDTGNMDPTQIRERITPATKAIIVVHVYGHPAEMDEINQIADEHGLMVIEDAAEAHGAEYKGKPCGSLGHAATFSFYANKIITTGEGGMVTSNHSEWIETARCLRDHAFSKDRHFWHRHIGFNYRMSNLQAAIGVGQTERLKELVDTRRRHAAEYTEQLSEIRGLILPVEYPHVKNVYWMFGVRVDDDFPMDRDAFRTFLAARGIETRTYFIPLHYQPTWFDQFRGQKFPVSEKLCRTGLYLPSGAGLSSEEIRYICTCIREAAQMNLSAV